ncbi:hypothetical protein [Ideonella paludis]|uniref:hypothetical protein n=1 Tax=Ideonella paludis TaxID=1233411 RepID=UPI0036375BCD
MLKRSPPPSRQADHTVALRDEWHRFHLGQVRSAEPRSGLWPRCVLWLDEGSIPELTHYDGDVQYAAQVLQKTAEDNGTFAERVQVVVHATRKLGEHHQVLYSAIPLSRWTEMMAYAARAEEAIPVYLLPGLAVQRCTPKSAVLMCFTAFLCLVWEESGALQLRSSPMGLDSDVNAALRNMVEQAAVGDGSSQRYAYAELELFDFRSPSASADAPLQVEEWWPKGLALRAWFNSADGNTLRRQFERLGAWLTQLG